MRLRRIGPLAIAAVLGLWLSGCGINNIPTEQEQAKAAWSEVQNQYQRRADLIPNLVNTVKGFAQQEQKVLIDVTEARAKATMVQINANQLTDPEALRRFQDAQAQLSGALGRLLAVSENYPQLKSNANFLALQSQLEGTENRISVARRDQRMVSCYDRIFTIICQPQHTSSLPYEFPRRSMPRRSAWRGERGRAWASSYDAKPMATFTTTEENQRAPTVQF